MATPAPTRSGGDISTFNIQHGFPEALVRGMRSSFLQDQDYHHVQQCETLDDVRLNLTESDYAEAIADFNSLTPNTLQKAAVEKVRQYVLIPTWCRFIRVRRKRKNQVQYAHTTLYSCTYSPLFLPVFTC